MTKGIVQTQDGFAVKDFETGNTTAIGQLSFSSYMEALGACYERYFPGEYFHYLYQAEYFDKEPDADTWENMIYADDPRGIYDGETKEYRNVTSMDRGAATDEEIAFVDALDATYKSLMAMVRE